MKRLIMAMVAIVATVAGGCAHTRPLPAHCTVHVDEESCEYDPDFPNSIMCRRPIDGERYLHVIRRCDDPPKVIR